METWVIKLTSRVEESRFREKWESNHAEHPEQPGVDFTFLENNMVKANVHEEEAQSWAPRELIKTLELVVRQAKS